MPLMKLCLMSCNVLLLVISIPAAARPVEHKILTDVCKRYYPAALDCVQMFSEAQIDFSAPPPSIRITKGGLYTGTWSSTDPQKPAVIIETEDPVTIKDSKIISAGHLIYGRNINLKVENVSGIGWGQKSGKFLDVTAQKYLEVINCRIANLWGIRLSGNETRSPVSVILKGNLAYNLREGQEDKAHFIQLVNGVFPAAQITDNIAINLPFESHVEDVISLYNARGTREEPILVSNNKLFGAYPSDPVHDGYSGGGIIIDGDDRVSAEMSSAHIVIEKNDIISTTNYGIAIASGHDNSVRNNRIVSSGLLNDGRPIKAQNVGIYIWNINRQPQSVFFNNSAFRNDVFWMKVKDPKAYSQETNHLWLPDCTKKPGACSNDILSSSHTMKSGLALQEEAMHLFRQER